MVEKPIVFVFSSFYEPTVGGAEIAVSQIIARTARDFEYHIITHRINLGLPAEQIMDARGNEVFIHRLGFGTVFDLMFIFPFLVARKGMELTKKFQGRKMLLWGIMVSYSSIGAYILRKFRKNIPFVLTIQEGDGEWEFSPRNMGLSAFWWRRIFKKVNYVTAISNFLAKIVRERGYKGAMDVVPNGVDEKLLDIRHPEFAGEKVIFSSSRLVRKNGLDLLLVAAARIKDDYPFKVIIAGDGKEKQQLTDLCEELGIKDKVDFLGSVPYDDLIKLYSAADIFVRPSRSEGLGSSFLEAMAAGLIIIGTPVGGIPDFLWEGKTGFFAVPDNIDSLEQAIRTAFFLSPVKKAQMISNARALIRAKYLWDDVALKMKDIFNKLV